MRALNRSLHATRRQALEQSRQAGAWEKGGFRTVARLERLGVPPAQARAWVHAWDVSTAGLDEFRRASDYWEVGYAYARDEFRAGFAPPDVALDAHEVS